MAVYTKLQLHALFDIERRNREYAYILAKSTKIKNEVLEELKLFDFKNIFIQFFHVLVVVDSSYCYKEAKCLSKT